MDAQERAPIVAILVIFLLVAMVISGYLILTNSA